MDAVVHICYEFSGTIGAITSAVLINRLGNNYSFIVSPVAFCLAGITWSFIPELDWGKLSREANHDENGEKIAYNTNRDKSGYLGACVAFLLFSNRMLTITSVGQGFSHFGLAIGLGAKRVLTSRKLVWLIPGYSLALFAHRYVLVFLMLLPSD